MNHPKAGTPEYQEHVAEEIEYFSNLFKEGESREKLHTLIPPSWQEAERRAAMVIHAKTGDFMNGHIEKRLNSRARAAQIGLNMEFIPADLNMVDLPENEFDVVYCGASLHHVIELERLAEQIRKTLRPEGDLIIIDVIPPNGYLMWPKTREVVRAMFKTLPERFRVNHTGYADSRVDEQIWEVDTSQHGMECVRSGDIVEVFERAFPVKMFVPYFSISRRFLDNMYGPNYDLSDPLSSAIFDWVWEMDRYYIESNILLPETFFGSYRNDKNKNVNWRPSVVS